MSWVGGVCADERLNGHSWRTKAKGEDAIREYHPTATVIRPSLLFGPGDSFFSVSTFFFLYGGGDSETILTYVFHSISALQPWQSTSLSSQSLEAVSLDSSESWKKKGTFTLILILLGRYM